MTHPLIIIYKYIKFHQFLSSEADTIFATDRQTDWRTHEENHKTPHPDVRHIITLDSFAHFGKTLRL